jgi:hypothetical protein
MATEYKKIPEKHTKPSDNNVDVNDQQFTTIPQPIKPSKPWYSSREDIPITGECTDSASANGNTQLTEGGLSCTCDSTTTDGDFGNGEYAPLDFESIYLISFGSENNIDNQCCTPSLFDWYNTLYGENNIPCSSPVLGNNQCNYVEQNGIKNVNYDSEKFFITMRGNSAFSAEIECPNRNYMWMREWCVGDYTSTDCVSASDSIHPDIKRLQYLDVCPPVCETPGDDNSCSEITIWFNSTPNYSQDSRECNFKIHSYYNWEDNTDDTNPGRGNRGSYLDIPIVQLGGAEKLTNVPGQECPPHINCPPGQMWVGYPTCECQVIFEPLYACHDPNACNYNPNSGNPCVDCCMYFVCPDGTCARTEQDCPYWLNPGCTNPEACNYCPPFLQDENGTSCEELAGPNWNTSGSQTCPCTPEPELCWFSEPSCDCGGEIVGDFCDCNEGVEEVWCPDIDGDGYGSCVGVQEQCPVIACDGSQPDGWVNNCSDDCDHPNGFDCFGVCGGVATFDSCGVCGGNCNLPDNCDGACNCDGDTTYDSCGVCGGNGGTIQCWDGSFVCTPDLCEETESGCTDPLACNYSASALSDDGSCYYPSGCDNICGSTEEFDQCGVCGGDNSTCCPEGCSQPTPDCVNGSCICSAGSTGCDDVCGSGLVDDQCGICGGDNSSCEDCAGTPNGNLYPDCAGVCGGTSIEDCNGVCYNPDSNPVNFEDCAGVCNGTSVEDCAGVCDGTSVEDCAGTCNGTAVKDCAGTCNGTAVKDCAGTCNGTAVEDCAGVCNGDSVEDCAGVCNGDSVEDCAGVCGGDSVEDCAGECNGDSIEDCAGECNGDSVEDCNGECGGSAVPDCAFVCGGNSYVDCNNVCGGNWIEDCNGVCYNPDSNPVNIEDCAGECNGSAVEDCAGVCGGSAYIDCNGDCNDVGAGSFDCGGVCVSAGTICGCTNSQALNYDSTATSDDGSCYLMDCANFSSCDEYCVDGSNYCTTPGEIDTFCYTNNEFPAIYIQAGDFQYVSYTIPIIDGIQSYSLSDILNNSLYENNPDEGASSLQDWSQGTAIFASVNYDEGDLYTGISTFSSDGSWTGTLTTLDVSAGYYIKSYGSGWLKWTLPVT